MLIASVEEIEAIAQIETDAVTSQISAIIGPQIPPTETVIVVPIDGIFLPPGPERFEPIPIPFQQIPLSFQFCSPFNLEGVIGCAVNAVLETLIGAIIQGLTEAIAVIQNIVAATNRIIDEISGAVGDILEGVEGIVGDAVDEIIGTLGGQIDKVIDAVEGIADGIEGIAGDVIDGIRGEIEGITGEVEGQGEETRETVREGIEGVVEGQEQIADDLDGAVQTILQSQVEQTETILSETGATVRESVAVEIAPVRASVEALEAAQTGLGSGVGRIADSIGDMLGSAFFGAPAAFGQLFTEGLDAAFGGLLERLETDLAGFFRRMLVTFGMPEEIADRFLAAARAGDPGNQVITIGIFTAAIGFALPLIAAQAMAPIVTELVQLINQVVGPSLLTPEQLLTLLTRGDIPRSQFDQQMGQLGFDSANRDRFFRLRRQLLGVRDLSQLWLRGELDEGALRARLAELGVLDREASEVMTLSRPLPGVQDLITMAVREVFTPDVRSRFGLDQDFPPEFQARAAQVGLTPEIARDFWAAHWALPSATQGFQMFQRQIIDQADLELLLRSLDVMPFWRDRLIQLSFRPIDRKSVV